MYLGCINFRANIVLRSSNLSETENEYSIVCTVAFWDRIDD